MLRRVAKIKGRPLLIVPVPLLSPGLSSHWLAFVTDVDTQTGRSLVDSMANEVVVSDDSITVHRRRSSRWGTTRRCGRPWTSTRQKKAR